MRVCVGSSVECVLVFCAVSTFESIDVKNVFTFFYFFIKSAFLTFVSFLNIFYFLVAKIFSPTKPVKLLHKPIFSDGFNMVAIGNSHDEEPWLSNVVMHIRGH